jgi:lipopolysaccharide export system protein LptA
MMLRQRLINNIVSLTGLLFVALVLAVQAFAAEPVQQKIKGPIVITSQLLTADNKAHTALFEKSVIARTKEMTMYADRMLVYSDEKTGNVSKIEATGKVKVIKVNRIITSNEATYYADGEKVIFTNEPKAVEGENVVTGKTMTYLMNEDLFLVEDSKVFLIKKKE